MKTIYNTFVKMESQEQCDRMKQLCLDNGLILIDNFRYNENKLSFRFSSYQMFGIWHIIEGFQQVTEKEFIELLKTK